LILNKRTDGVPPGAVYVGRPTKWGNPFTVEHHGREQCISLYRQWLMDPEQACLRALAVRELAGRDLVCWCAPLACHAEILSAVANGGAA
jgi:hypothetical protein